MNEQATDQSYDPGVSEVRMQRYWSEQGTFNATENSANEKFYCLIVPQL